MSKPSKITVKHYLNTNSKPYIINGISYYSIYILLTAKRQNTKVKSITLNEYYNEADFDDLISSKDSEDVNLIENEIGVLENISNLVINELGDFDTHFITAYFNFIPTIQIWDVDIESFKLDNKCVNFYKESGNNAGLKIDDFFLLLTPNIAKRTTLYDFYNKSNQEILRDFLIKNNIKSNIEDLANDINRMIFYQSFDKFKWYLNGSKKNSTLLEKYSILFDEFTHILTCSIIDKYVV
jgi:hypothetical protein